MFELLILRVFLAGLGLSLQAGPLGCLVVWRRMAYFGDSLAHSALLGIALGLVYGWSTELGTMIVCTAFALLLLALQHRGQWTNDTLLGILAHAGLSLGMIVLSFLEAPQIDIHSYLFGDILTVQWRDLVWIYGSALAVMVILKLKGTQLVLMAINEDLARAEGVKVFWLNALLMAMMALVVIVSLKIVGILLITSLLLIPSAAARQWACTPSAMAILASLTGMAAVIGGMLASLYYDLPTGPAIVITATLFFALSLLAGSRSSRRNRPCQTKVKR